MVRHHRDPTRLFLGLLLVPTGLGSGWLAWGLGWSPLVAWLTTLNLLTPPLWGYDKLAAKRGWKRVPEVILHTGAALGAVPASFLSMQLFRHKTLKPAFRRRYWIFFSLQAILVLLWMKPGLRPW